MKPIKLKMEIMNRFMEICRIYGLGKALKHIPITEKRNSARKRLTMTEAK